jgi:crotonobetainyl-CoA:carnitine CoA-transferase CaiB-like acyl-CoA transferase
MNDNGNAIAPSAAAWPARDGRPAPGPLAGVRVLDLTAYAVGPYAVTLLAQLGADVVRVDPPYGDPIRMVQPTHAGEPTTYSSCNIGKRSVVLDLKDEAGRAVALRLAAAADVVVENARAGTLERLGLGYDQLRDHNPDLVYCASSSFGDTGPLRTMGSTDPQGQAFSGFASVNGHAGGGPEVLRYVAMIDLATSMYLLQAVLVGLYTRRRTGRGQYLRTSQMEAAIALQTTRLAEFFATGVPPRPLGSGTATIVPSRAFRCQDGASVSVTARTDAQWAALCEALELPGLGSDPRLATAAGRIEHRTEIDAALERAFAHRPAHWWSRRLPRAGVACVRPRTLEDHLDGHLRGGDAVVRVPHLAAGDTLAVAGPLWSFERTTTWMGAVVSPGRDTAEILGAVSPMSEPTSESSTQRSTRSADPAQRRSATGAVKDAGGGPLAGVLVLDATEGVSGPYCSLLLAGLGADVIKLEPLAGDWLRSVGPPWIDGTGAAAAQLNRGKASVAVDLASDGGQQVLRALLAEADVLLHEMTAEDASARGLGPAALRALNPALVDCAVTPLGESGPWAGLPATELEVQSLAGVSRYLGSLDEPPVRLGADVGGILAGCTAFHAVMAGLLARDGVGGQHVAVSQLGALLGTGTVMIAALDQPDEWTGFHCNAAVYPPDQGIATADGRLYYGQPLRSEEAWQSFCRAIGAEALLDDPRFATRALRMPNMADLRRELEPYFLRFTTADLMELIVRSDGIGVPINDYADLVAHPQVAALGQVVQTATGPALGLPWRRRDDDFPDPVGTTPSVGADTLGVLARSGMSGEEIDALLTSGAIGAAAGGLTTATNSGGAQ